MPVNMDPAKKRRKNQADSVPPQESAPEAADNTLRAFGEETHIDREKDLADAEWKNLWDATEVIDMDKI
jgi:hypothetical protein